MTITITIGWWLVPMLVTLLAVGWAALGPGGLDSLIDGVAALLVTMTAWIAYLGLRVWLGVV